jgi:hypothetical protein
VCDATRCGVGSFRQGRIWYWNLSVELDSPGGHLVDIFVGGSLGNAAWVNFVVISGVNMFINPGNASLQQPQVLK